MMVSMSVSWLRHVFAMAAAVVLLVVSTRSSAQEARAPSPDPSIPRLPWAWQSLGVSFGGAHYAESTSLVKFGEGIGPADPFVTRGEWVGLEAEYMLWPWFALAARGRLGWLRRGPPNRVEWEYPPGTDLRRIDPQLGDGPFGGAVAIMFRFLPKRTALDVGLTTSVGSFRPRYWSHPLVRCLTCYFEGQGTYSGEEFWPTARVSRTGPGFVYVVGTGESFVRTYEPGALEILFGYRWDDIEFVGGLGRGIALRLDARVWSSHWLSFDLSMNPWNREVPGYESARSILTVTFTRRWSSFAPL